MPSGVYDHTGHVRSPETRKKMSENHSKGGWKLSEETKEKMRGRKWTEESKLKMSKTNKGHFVSEETKNKISLSKKGKSNGLLGKKKAPMSEETKLKLSKYFSGAGSAKWKGGYKKLQGFRSNGEYKSWRKQCLLRDNFTCQVSDISGGKLEVHHINNFSDFPEFRTKLDNGITLSEEIHKEFHRIYGRFNNTKEQLEEFKNKLFKTTQ